MANNENITIKVDHNNLIYIDPNSVMENGVATPRNIKQEDLSIFVNLETELVPRTSLLFDNKSEMLSVAKGTLNFLKPKNKDGNFSTQWTESMNDYKKMDDKDNVFTQSDQSGESFGIQDISIQIKAGMIPIVTIKFIDVRGKTLFESPENSPYKSFFHLPWPVYYLTVKGYYGKAVRYKLHLVKFSSMFDDDGNFLITTEFVGSTFAFLNDIPMSAVLNAPYMFGMETTQTVKENTKTGKKEQKVIKHTKGYSILKSVYAEMKQKKIIPQDFPVKTIQDIATIAQTLDVILEQQIFKDVVDMKVLNSVHEYATNIEKYYNQVNSWKTVYIDKTKPLIVNEKYYHPLIKDKGGRIKGAVEGSMERIIKINTDTLKNSELFNNELQKNKKIKFDTSILSKNSIDVNKYLYIEDKMEYFCIDELLYDISEISTVFNQQKINIEKEVEKKMNEIMSSKDGIGFKPTIRNLFAVILANAEVYIRLMKDVHTQSFGESQNRKKLIGEFSSESVGDSIYPWPEISKTVSTDKSKVIVYPGEETMRKSLKSDDAKLWPEVEFVEEFVSIATKRSDNLSNKENGVNDVTYNFEDSTPPSNNITSSFMNISYYDRSFVSIIYEMYERTHKMLLTDNFDKEILKEMVKIEFENISNSIKDQNDVLSILTAIFFIDDGKQIIERFDDLLKAYSSMDRLPYKQDHIPTTTYIKDLDVSPFEIKDIIIDSKDTKPLNTNFYGKINELIKKHKTTDDVLIRYPFSSEEYKQYTKDRTINNNIGNFLSVKNGDNFLVGESNPKAWFKMENIFDKKLKYGDNSTHIFNTHFFHHQLYHEFLKNTSKSKFTGSAYLFLNSLPFVDLDDEITINGEKIILYKLLNNVSSTQHIPYHLLLKWGSVYHRHKMYLLKNEDILSNIQSNDTIKDVNVKKLFNNDELNQTYFAVDIDRGEDVGVHPFYDALFHQIVRGYNHYNLKIGNDSYNQRVADGSINNNSEYRENDLYYWTNFVNNESYDNQAKYVTILPSSGGNDNINRNYSGEILNETFSDTFIKNFRIIWEDEIITETLVGKKLPPYSNYFKTYDDEYSLDGGQKNIMDLIAIFPTEMLDHMEDMFLKFCDENVPNTDTYNTPSYTSFQDILRDIVTIDKTDDINVISIKESQKQNLIKVNDKIRGYNNLLSVTIKNPKGYNSNILYGFVGLNKNKTSFGGFTQTNHNENLKLIEYVLGTDVDGSYELFFITYNIKITLDNLKKLKPIIYIYAGLRNRFDRYPNREELNDYISNNIILGNDGVENKYNLFMTLLLNKLKDLKMINETKSINFVDGYGNNAYKLDLYNSFKGFNDKWTSGKSIPNNLLIEDFLFLDKANKDIGDNSFLNIDNFLTIVNPKNIGNTLYGALNGLLKDTDMDIRTLPTYTNFYGGRSSLSVIPSKNVANDIFGVFNEVDYNDSSPKTIIQYVGKTSSHLNDMGKDYMFKADSTDISSPNSPLIITSPNEYSKMSLSKSNKVVAFEVSFGDQNQSIFSKIGLNQDSFKNTAQSINVSDELARSSTGSGTKSIDIGLFKFFNKQSYTCDVTCMGNMMIQPTMYFQLKNVPMFKGAYWITDVSHTIADNKVVTNFKGVRIPLVSLPDPEDSFMSSYKSLFDKIMNKSKIKTTQAVSTTEKTITTKDGTFVTDPGNNIIKGEQETKDKIKVGETKFGVPYNGFNGEKYIQKVFNSKEYLRATVGRLGVNNDIKDNDAINMINLLPIESNVYRSDGTHGLTWKDLNEVSNDCDFYFLNVNKDVPVEKIIRYKTQFKNPIERNEVTVEPSWNLDRRNNKLVFNGFINYNDKSNFGILMSNSLMRKLSLQEGDIVYFNHL